MNYSTQVGKPTAHITKKKSRLKVYNGHIIFLNDKDNFEFEIHNPKQKSVLVKIKLNGEYISTSGIVLRPGQRVFLERFLDSNNKFEFSTYEVSNTSENRSAIDLNGDVRIEFYDEQEPIHNNHYYSNGIVFGNLNYTGSGTFSQPIGTTTSTYYNTPNNITHTSGISSVSYTSSSNITGNVNNTFSGPNIKSKKFIETGRVEKGEKSKQEFGNSYSIFNLNTSHEIIFKIQPLSVKNKTTEDIKHYCTECGAKTKTKFKFCPSCGNEL
jgi:hypothetical protein